MGITYIKARVINPAKPAKTSLFKFLVDSGAVYTLIPEADLAGLGIKPSSEREFILANGEVVVRPVGNAFFEYQGITGAAPVVFGEGDVYLLGATTLEAWGVILDPLRRELKPLPMSLM
ncbi:MAG: aspartyl protease family protein [Candidatus Hydrogenedentes bacterium]|nr:aspartyl protease family protein [Candidatus Hydrogenedentota bacterium]